LSNDSPGFEAIPAAYGGMAKAYNNMKATM
jgi:hypothetical protein